MFYSADMYPGFLTGQKFWFETFERFKTFPWWDPYVDFGTSFLYNPTRGSFYPLNYLQLFVSPLFYFRWTGYLHLLLLTAAFYSWGKTRKVAPLLLLTLSLLIATSPFINVFSVTSIIYLHAVTWTAWIFAELEKSDTPKFSLFRFLIFWTLLIGVGEPFCAFLSGVGTIAHLYPRKKWKVLLCFFALCIVIGALVFGHALAILPYTTRRTGIGESVSLSFSLHPYRLITLLSPLFYGHPFLNNFDPDSATNDSPYTPRFFFDTLYFSLPLVIFAIMGIRDAFRKKNWIPLLLLAFGCSLAFGRWGLMKYVAKIPPFSFLRYPEKMIWVSSILFLGFSLKNFFDGETHSLKKDKLILALIGLAVIIPIFAAAPEYPIAAVSFLVGVSIFVFPATKDLILAFLVLGLLQNYLAFPTQRVAPAIRDREVSKTGVDLLERIPEGSLNRMEITPNFFDDGYPHENLLWGSNMVFRRASLFSYESINTPLNEEIKVLLYGENYQDSVAAKEKAHSAKEISDAVQLTNLHLIAVKNDRPMQSLLASVESSNAIFNVEKGDGKALYLIPKEKPSPAWYFSSLKKWDSSSKSHLMWPPQVDTARPFFQGVQKRRWEFPVQECSLLLNPQNLKDSAIFLVDENHLMLDADLPCEGWVFLSQNLFPGWRAFESGVEIPLYPMNESLTGFNLNKGKHHIELYFHPFQALFKTLLPFL